MLPPHELQNKTFSRVLRGYNSVEVDEHIGFIIEKYTELYRENDELERRLRLAETQLAEFRSDEESIRSALVNAQKASAKIINEANERADVIMLSAKTNCNKVLADFRGDIKRERDELYRLSQVVAEFKARLFAQYQQHITYIEQISPEPDEDEFSTPDEVYVKNVVNKVKGDIASGRVMMNDSGYDDDDDDNSGNAPAAKFPPPDFSDAQSANPTINQSAQPMINQSANPMINQSAQPMINQSAQPMINQSAQPMINQSAQPMIKEITPERTQPATVNTPAYVPAQPESVAQPENKPQTKLPEPELFTAPDRSEPDYPEFVKSAKPPVYAQPDDEDGGGYLDDSVDDSAEADDTADGDDTYYAGDDAYRDDTPDENTEYADAAAEPDTVVFGNVGKFSDDSAVDNDNVAQHHPSAPQASYKSASVKDTIRELNKKFASDDDDALKQDDASHRSSLPRQESAPAVPKKDASQPDPEDEELLSMIRSVTGSAEDKNQQGKNRRKNKTKPLSLTEEFDLISDDDNDDNGDK